MKKFYEIDDFSQIEVKTSYCSLKSLLFDANGIIYKYLHTYAFPQFVSAAREELTKVMKQISDLEISSSKYRPQQEEILEKGRKIVISLQKYERGFQYDNSCIEAISTTAKYQVLDFLQTKDKMSFAKGLELLGRNNLTYSTIHTIEEMFSTKVNVSTFYRLQDEIINLLKTKLDTYAFKLPKCKQI